ncbi:MAG TPA: hypothetical protein VGI40_09300 [Pirellulaceae bacterium]
MKNFLAALLAALSLVCLTAVAEAGGGTKSTSQIRAVNHGNETLVVFITAGTEGNADVQAIDAGTAVTSDFQDALVNENGHSITKNGSFSFTALAVGDYTLTYEYLGNGGTTTGAVGTQTVHVNKGQTVTVTFTGNDTDGADATVSPSSAASL